MHVYVLATIRYLSDPTDQLIPPNISNNLSLHHTMCNVEYVCEYTGRSLSYALCSSTLLHDVYVCTVSLTCLNMSRTDYTVVCITKFRPKIVRPFFTFNHPINILMLATDI